MNVMCWYKEVGIVGRSCKDLVEHGLGNGDLDVESSHGVRSRWRRRQRSRKKPTPTRTTRPVGRGFWQVGNFQPAPVPTATRTRDPCGLPNP